MFTKESGSQKLDIRTTSLDLRVCADARASDSLLAKKRSSLRMAIAFVRSKATYMIVPSEKAMVYCSVQDRVEEDGWSKWDPQWWEIRLPKMRYCDWETSTIKSGRCHYSAQYQADHLWQLTMRLLWWIGLLIVLSCTLAVSWLVRYIVCTQSFNWVWLAKGGREW